MRHLILALLGTPLTIWILASSYITVFDTPDVTLARRLLAVFLSATALRTNAFLLRSHAFASRARSLGCGQVPMAPYKDPILGLDGFWEAIRALQQFRFMDYYHDRFRHFGQTHYSLALGRKVLMTNSSENIKTILATNMDDWPIEGPRLHAVLPVLGPRSIFSSNGADWHDARSMIRPSFVRDQVADLRCFDRHIRNLLAAVPADGSTFDIQDLLLKMTMDSSTDFMLGYSTNSLVRASPEAAQFLRDFEYASAECTRKARLGPILFHIPHRKLSKAIASLRGYVRFYLCKAVAEKEKETQGGETADRSYVFLDELLKAGAPEEHVVDQILSIIVAGRDTTAAAMSAAFYCLGRSPEAVRKLRKEISDLDYEGDHPTWEQLRQMKYLNNVIREALRLFPPVSTNSRAASRETVLPRGGGPDGSMPVLVPKDTPVRWSLYSLHRQKDVFGEDADAFRPERWEDLRVG